MLFRFVLAGIACLAMAIPALAENPKTGEASRAQHGSMHAMPSQADPSGTLDSPSSKAFTAANNKMHAAMGNALTGDADVDFVRSMIPHHQGAIDMARIELTYGHDPMLRKLAEEIISAQKAEIARMENWLSDQSVADESTQPQ